MRNTPPPSSAPATNRSFSASTYPEAHEPWLRQVDGLPEHPHTGAAVQALPYFGIDPGNLQRLTAEVTSVKSKAAGKELGWSYPDYFFGKEPAVKRDASPATGKPTKKKRKKQPTE
jgi:hypothetical protein